MHYVQAKGILSANNGMNLYRGCSHGCIYCDSRSACYHMNHDFEDIEVKQNAIELLELALKHKRKRCMIGTGSMTDPYIPLEKQLGNVRKALECIERYEFGCSVITKSDLILRDLDLLQKINDKTKCVVQMTLTTFDEKLCKIIEPHVCSTKERISVLQQMKERGIPTVVWLSPILPFINDTQQNISELIDQCHNAGVYGIICFGMGLTLREGNREYFYSKLDQNFPGMKKRYIQTYGNEYIINSPDHDALMKLFHQKCEEYHIVHNNQRIFEYLNTFEEKQKTTQMNLFDFTI